jgi:hypothetical protein
MISPTLAIALSSKATSVSAFGFQLFFSSMPFVAQAAGGGLASKMGGALGVLNMIGLVLAFGGLLFAAIMFMMGQTERMIYGLVGAIIGGLAFIIVKAMFQSGGSGSGIEGINMAPPAG